MERSFFFCAFHPAFFRRKRSAEIFSFLFLQIPAIIKKRKLFEENKEVQT